MLRDYSRWKGVRFEPALGKSEARRGEGRVGGGGSRKAQNTLFTWPPSAKTVHGKRYGLEVLICFATDDDQRCLPEEMEIGRRIAGTVVSTTSKRAVGMVSGACGKVSKAP